MADEIFDVIVIGGGVVVSIENWKLKMFVFSDRFRFGCDFQSEK